MLKDFILVYVLYENNFKVLAFFKRIHIDAKKVIKKCLFSHRNQEQIFHQQVMVVLWVSFC